MDESLHDWNKETPHGIYIGQRKYVKQYYMQMASWY
jgi:hypothetical protein